MSREEFETPSCDPGPWCSGFESDDVKNLPESFARDIEKGLKVSRKSMDREVTI